MSSQNSDHLSRRSTKICSSDDGVLNLHPQQKESVPVTSRTVFHGPPTHAETRRKKSEVVETTHPVGTLGFGWQSRKRRSSRVMRKAGRIDEGWAAFVQCCFILLSVCLVPLYLHVYQESVWGFLQSFRSTCVTSEATRSINVPAEIHFLYIFINLRLFFLIVFQSLDGDRQRWNDNVLFYGPRPGLRGKKD